MSVSRITPEEAAARMASGADVTYVDVRSVPEFEQGHPVGAVNIPLLDRPSLSAPMAPNSRFLEVVERTFERDAALLVACAAGGRSLKAAQLLMTAGFQNIVDVRGGYGGRRMPPVEPGWVAQGLPTTRETGPGESYQDILAKVDA